MTYDDINDLVLAAQKGAPSAIEQLYNAVHPALMQAVLPQCTDPYEAEDIIQDAFILILANIHKVPSPQYFIPWAKKVTANYCSRYMYKLRDLPVDNIDELMESMNTTFATDPLDGVVLKEKNAQIDSLIATLSPGLRRTVELKYYGDYKITEIAEILDVPVGTVKSRIHKAKIHLKKRISEDKHFFSVFTPLLPMSMVLPEELGGALNLSSASTASSTVATGSSQTMSGTAVTSTSQSASATVVGGTSKTSNALFFKAGLATGTVAVVSAGVISAFGSPADTLPAIDVDSDMVVDSNSTGDTLYGDMTAPQILDLVIDGEYIQVSLEDEDSGINYDSAYGMTSSGKLVSASHYDVVAGLIYFPKVYEEFVISVSDMAGNTCNSRLTLTKDIQ